MNFLKTSYGMVAAGYTGIAALWTTRAAHIAKIKGMADTSKTAVVGALTLGKDVVTHPYTVKAAGGLTASGAGKFGYGLYQHGNVTRAGIEAIHFTKNTPGMLTTAAGSALGTAVNYGFDQTGNVMAPPVETVISWFGNAGAWLGKTGIQAAASGAFNQLKAANNDAWAQAQPSADATRVEDFVANKYTEISEMASAHKVVLTALAATGVFAYVLYRNENIRNKVQDVASAFYTKASDTFKSFRVEMAIG